MPKETTTHFLFLMGVRHKRGETDMITWLYFFAFAASIAMLGSVLFRHKQIDTMYALLCVMISVNSMGRWLVALSTTVEQAIWANKILYVGGIYLPLLLLVVMARLCEIRMPGWAVVSMAVYDTLLFALAMTIGHSGIYYKSIDVAQGDGYHYLIKEYGPTHVLYPIMMVLSAVMLVVFVIRAFRKRGTASFRTIASCGGLGIAVIVTYLLTRLLHSPIEWVGLCYLAASAMIMSIFDRISMFDMSINVSNAIDHMGEYGYLVFDDRMRFMGSNDLARKIFPEVASFRREERVPLSDSYFYREVMEWSYGWRDGSPAPKTIPVGERYMELSVRDIVYGRKGKKVGYLIEMVDRTSEHRYITAIEDYNTRLAAEVEEKTAHISFVKDMMVVGMAAMVESRDNSTGGHIRRTSQVVRVFAQRLMPHSAELGLSEELLGMVIKAAPMHDLGKISIDDDVLRKNGKFTDAEYAEMKRHSAEGARIVRSILEGVEDERFVTVAENVAHYHHEKWDGSGYPCALAGTAIPIEARIMALADVFDALVSKRCYKEAFTFDKAFRIIESSIGTHFDPALGWLFLQCRPALEEIYSSSEGIAG